MSWSDRPGHEVRSAPTERCTALFVNDGAIDLGALLTPLIGWWVGR